MKGTDMRDFQKGGRTHWWQKHGDFNYGRALAVNRVDESWPSLIHVHFALPATAAQNVGGQPPNEDLLLLFPLWPTLFEERSITRLARPVASVALQGVATAVCQIYPVITGTLLLCGMLGVSFDLLLLSVAFKITK